MPPPGARWPPVWEFDDDLDLRTYIIIMRRGCLCQSQPRRFLWDAGGRRCPALYR
jgi:hypothetical protein